MTADDAVARNDQGKWVAGHHVTDGSRGARTAGERREFRVGARLAPTNLTAGGADAALKRGELRIVGRQIVERRSLALRHSLQPLKTVSGQQPSGFELIMRCVLIGKLALDLPQGEFRVRLRRQIKLNA